VNSRSPIRRVSPSQSSTWEQDVDRDRFVCFCCVQSVVYGMFTVLMSLSTFFSDANTGKICVPSLLHTI